VVPRSRVRKLLPIVLLIAIVGVGVSLLLKRFPNWADSESFDAAQAAKLQSANLSAPVANVPDSWPQWRGPARDGRAATMAIRTDWAANPPKLVWSTPLGGGYSTFAIVDGHAYTQDYASNREGVVCLDAKSGRKNWEHRYAVDYSPLRMGYAAGPRATPTVSDGRIYTVGATGVFLCLEVNGETPKELWRHDLLKEFRAAIPSWGVASSPLISGDLVIVQPGGKDGSVVAFNKMSGELRWKTSNNPSGYSSPVEATIAGVRQIVAVTGDAVLGIRPDDGQLLWSHDWRTPNNGNVATPVVVNDWIFISSQYGKGCTLLHVEPSGEGFAVNPVYFRKGRGMQNHHSTSVHRDGYIYGFDNETLTCLNLRTGEVEPDWNGQRTPDGKRIDKGSLILVDKFLIGLTQTGNLFLAEATPERFRFHGMLENVLSGNECWASPVLVGGNLYLRDGTKAVCWAIPGTAP